MTDAFNRFKSLVRSMPANFSGKTFPLAIAGVLFIAFGLVITNLGFYQDDWHHLYFGHTLGLARLWDMFLYDGRPFAAYLYMAGFKVLGFQPLHWQISTLLIRFLTVLFAWLLFSAIWPAYKRSAAWAALLFAVYPLFKVQALSVAYTVHWTGYLLYLISLWAMVQSLRKPRLFWIYLILSIITGMLHLALIEYFSGAELVRPLILWLLLGNERLSPKARLSKTLRLWLPYLLVLAAFFVYRIYLIPRPAPDYQRNVPILFYGLFSTPLPALVTLLQDALQDSIYILMTYWSNVFAPDIFKLTQPANLKIILICTLTGGMLYFYLKQLKIENENSMKWPVSMLVIGLALVLFGPIPAWITGQSVSQDNPLWSGRLGLASMVGASLVVVALLELLVKESKYRLVAFVVIIAFSLSWHLRMDNDYRWSWVKQSRFYHQLYWRAPYIQPNTALLSEEEVLPYMGEYPTAFALSTLYPKYDQKIDVPYWFFNVPRRFPDKIAELASGFPLAYDFNFGRFNGNSKDSLVISYKPEENRCLWVLRPEDADIRILPALTRQMAPASNLSRIKPVAPQPYKLPTDIFGEPSSDWCYYFEKADLARQFGEWERIVQLWEEASAVGLQPQNGVEYLPFIEGFAHQGDWEQAVRLSMQSNRISEAMPKILCPTWAQIESQMQPSAEQAAILSELRLKLRCGQ
jgi:hypothetical protein